MKDRSRWCPRFQVYKRNDLLPRRTPVEVLERGAVGSSATGRSGVGQEQLGFEPILEN